MSGYRYSDDRRRDYVRQWHRLPCHELDRIQRDALDRHDYGLAYKIDRELERRRDWARWSVFGRRGGAR